MVFPFLPCSSMCVSEQTGSGKTRFVYELLKHLTDMYEILYCYDIHQPLFDDIGEDDP